MPSTSNNFFLIVSEITNDFKISSLLSTTGFNLIEVVQGKKRWHIEKQVI